MNILKVPLAILRSRRDRLIAAGSVVGLGIVVALFALIFVSFGGVNPAANVPHSWLTYQILHFAFNRSTDVRSSEYVAPVDLTSPWRVKLGAQQFHLVCSNCHGGPGLGQSPIALSMQPRPQNLPAVINQFSDRELFWIVKHGVKFSAMPAWPNQTRDDEVWSMVSFLKELPTMTADTYLDLTKAVPHQDGVPEIPFKAPITLVGADTHRNTYPTNEFLYAAPAIGFGDQGLMTDPILTCSRCHGKDSTGSATGGESPNLTIHSAEYLRSSLRAYADGRRKSGYMQPVAAALSSDQIDALADYYAKLDDVPSAHEPGDAAVIARGLVLATEGIKATALPACGMCHDSTAGARIGAPRLNGQAKTYLIRQLTAMRDGDRGGSAQWNPMPAVAHGLNNDDMVAVSTYYANQAPTDPDKVPLSVAAAGLLGDPAKGEAIYSQACATCHGKDAVGDSEGEAPNLTMQIAAYQAESLHEYRAGLRDNVKMKLAASTLKDGDIDSLAAYLAKLPEQAFKGSVDAASAARGEKIAHEGIADRNVPACQGCHNAEMTASMPLIARLEGQNPVYLGGQLGYFASAEGARLSALNPMPVIARSLTARDQADVAAWYASQKPIPRAAATN